MEETVLMSLLESLATSSPLVLLLVWQWVQAEKRGTYFLEGWRASERRMRTYLREAANLEPEEITEGEQY